MRNDHQDSLANGLAVSEFAPNGKSADEIRGLWQWIETRLELSATTNVLLDQVISATDGMLHAATELAADETTTLAS
jgi:chromosome partitioning protein